MALQLRLRPGMTLTSTTDGLVIDDGAGETIVLPAVAAGVAGALAQLADGATEQELGSAVIAQAGADEILALHAALHRLRRAGALCHCAVGDDGSALVTLVAQGADFRLRERLHDPSRSYVVSRFSYVHRTEADGLVAESPLGAARVILHGARATALLAAYAEPARAGDAAGLADAATLLLNAAVLVAADDTSERHDVPGAAAGWWEFHDLLFHARARHGRHAQPYGGTSHRKGVCAPPPLDKPALGTPRIALARPDLDDLARRDPPFQTVLEGRRSVRDYGTHAITIEQLAELLFRALRVQHVLRRPADELDLSYRPQPAGGAIHELETYLVVGECSGLARGIYRYDPLAHELEPVAPDGADVEALLHAAWVTADRRSRPQVYVAFTARYQRLAWKYQSIVYSVILKNVGAVYQTLYLVATAMGLAPSALGGGHVDRLAIVAGLDPLEECPVGEFVLGTLER